MPTPSPSRALIYLCCWGTALIIGIVLFQTAWWPLAAMLLGLVGWHAFVILHAAGHGAFFQTHWANDLIGRLMSPFCTLPYGVWKYLHRQHHHWSGFWDKDPTLSSTRRRRPSWVWMVMNVCWKLWIPVFSLGYMLTTFWDPRQLRLLTASQRGKALFDWLLLIAIYGALAIMAPSTFWWKWLVSYVVFLSLADLSVLCQHVHLPHEKSTVESRAFTSHEQERFAREVRAPWWIEVLIFGHFNRHASHHMWPKLAPYHASFIEGVRTHEASAWKWLWEAKKMNVRELLQEEQYEQHG